MPKVKHLSEFKKKKHRKKAKYVCSNCEDETDEIHYSETYPEGVCHNCHYMIIPE